MKLYIEERAWGIDRKNGGRRERVTEKKAVNCAVGAVEKVGFGGREFYIDEVGTDFLVLSVRYENNPSANKTWRIEKGEKVGYFPFSFDGGYKYEFTLK